MPNGPWFTNSWGIRPAWTNDGRKRVYTHIVKPAIKPEIAPERVAPFQKIPPIMAGANWATAAKETRPIETKDT